MSITQLNDPSKNYKDALKQAKALARADKKDTKRIKDNPIAVQRIVQLHLTGNYTPAQIASIMNTSAATVKRILKEPEVLDKIIEYQDEDKKYFDSYLKSLREKALGRISELIDDEDSSVALSAVKDILDRTGHAAKKDNNVNINISYEEKLKELANTVDLSYIDTTYSVVDDTAGNLTEGADNGDT